MICDGGFYFRCISCKGSQEDVEISSRSSITEAAMFFSRSRPDIIGVIEDWFEGLISAVITNNLEPEVIK